MVHVTPLTMYFWTTSHTHIHTRTHIHTIPVSKPCPHTYIFKYIHIDTNKHPHVKTYLQTQSYTDTFIHKDTHTNPHACKRTYTNPHTCKRTYTHIHTHMQTNIHTNTYIQTYINTDIHTCTKTHMHTHICTDTHGGWCTQTAHADPRIQRDCDDTLQSNIWYGQIPSTVERFLCVQPTPRRVCPSVAQERWLLNAPGSLNFMCDEPAARLPMSPEKQSPMLPSGSQRGVVAIFQEHACQ